MLCNVAAILVIPGSVDDFLILPLHSTLRAGGLTNVIKSFMMYYKNCIFLSVLHKSG